MASRKVFIITAAVVFLAGIAYTGYNGFIKKKSYPIIGECVVSMQKTSPIDYVSKF